MAEIFPSFENIERLKVKPTDGELYLLNYLVDNLSSEYEVYFQPFLNGDMPDIVIMRKGAGVVIIEVKDWNLSSYNIDEKNNWHESAGNHVIRSPFKQVFGYKSNMFKLHINGLAEKNVMNKNFYNILKPFVYFHGSTKSRVENIYAPVEDSLKLAKQTLNNDSKNRQIEQSSYNNKMDYLDQKTRQVRRDKGLSIYEGKTQKLLAALQQDHVLFKDEIYDEFRRYLKPPYHISSQGININYDKKQTKLINSAPGFQKIKGVAGCGKTTILAKRAVNAHKRHDDRILILTYNKTLRNLIRDKISEVREDFSWGCFGITNYHSFITQMLNECGVDISPPQDFSKVSAYFDNLYSDESLFDDYIDKLYKYKTILIDEVQDYRPEWIKIIRKYFLSDDGEMILFGDDSQNIYERDVSKNNSAIVQGFGRWERLTKSYRSKMDSPLTSMSKSFQSKYLVSKYDIDLVDVEPVQSKLSFDLMKGIVFSDVSEIDNIYQIIFKHLKNEKIHPNDVTIISTNINFLRKLDQVIRVEANEKTQTTFESEEAYLELASRYGKNSSELRRELEDIRGSKKFGFNLNSGLIKLSTVHSFKGLESSTSIYILLKEDEDEMVYTGITRAKQNSILFIQKTSKYLQFFQDETDLQLEKIDLV
jgi:hypothetical protein